MSHKAEADKHYQEALKAVSEWQSGESPPIPAGAGLLLLLAHVAAVREQTEVLREIRDALGPRAEYSDDLQPDVPLELKYDIDERRQCDTQAAHQLRQQGWILLSYIPFGVTNETKRWTMGRPRIVSDTCRNTAYAQTAEERKRLETEGWQYAGPGYDGEGSYYTRNRTAEGGGEGG